MAEEKKRETNGAGGCDVCLPLYGYAASACVRTRVRGGGLLLAVGAMNVGVDEEEDACDGGDEIVCE